MCLELRPLSHIAREVELPLRAVPSELGGLWNSSRLLFQFGRANDRLRTIGGHSSSSARMLPGDLQEGTCD